MTEKKAEIILKTVIVIMGASLFGIPVLAFILYCFDEDIGERVLAAGIILSVAICIFYMILIRVLANKLKQKPIPAEKIPILFDRFEDFKQHIEQSLMRAGYRLQGSEMMEEEGEIALYVKSIALWEINSCVIVRVPELADEETLDMLDEKITKLFASYYGSDRITDTVNVILILCVNRVTPTFTKIVNGNIEQELKKIRLPVGISFGGKKIYMARQKDGFAIAKYQMLREEFLTLMGDEYRKMLLAQRIKEEEEKKKKK